MKLTYILESAKRLFKSRLFIAVASVLLIALTVTFTVICINWINNEGDSSVRYTVVFDSQGGSSVAPQKFRTANT